MRAAWDGQWQAARAGKARHRLRYPPWLLPAPTDKRIGSGQSISCSASAPVSSSSKSLYAHSLCEWACLLAGGTHLSRELSLAHSCLAPCQLCVYLDPPTILRCRENSSRYKTHAHWRGTADTLQSSRALLLHRGLHLGRAVLEETLLFTRLTRCSLFGIQFCAHLIQALCDARKTPAQR